MAIPARERVITCEEVFELRVPLHVGSGTDGRRRVREVVAVPGRAEDGVIELADVFTTRDGRLVRGSGYPPHPERFTAHGFDLSALLDDARWRG